MWCQIHAFYNELNDYTKGNVDVVISGAIGRKNYVEATEIFELLAKKCKKNSYEPSRAQGRGEYDKTITLEMKTNAMMRKLDRGDSKNIPLNQIIAMRVSDEGLAPKQL